MNHLQKAMACLLFVLLLLPPSGARGDGEQAETVVERAVAGVNREAEGSAKQTGYANDPLCRQIQDTYKAARKRFRRKSFKGYCGAYVAHQLVVLGINTSYLSASGKNTYDIYRNMDRTTGGYAVIAYSAKQYSLQEAMETILGEDPAACNILVGFQKGVSKSGKKYGHTLFIHGVQNGEVYFSDSSTRIIDDVEYLEGEPIVCSLGAFFELFAPYRLDGVVHFQRGDQPSITAEMTLGSSENASVLG